LIIEVNDLVEVLCQAEGLPGVWLHGRVWQVRERGHFSVEVPGADHLHGCSVVDIGTSWRPWWPRCACPNAFRFNAHRKGCPELARESGNSPSAKPADDLPDPPIEELPPEE
jgi:hypothetical protein